MYTKNLSLIITFCFLATSIFAQNTKVAKSTTYGQKKVINQPKKAEKATESDASKVVPAKNAQGKSTSAERVMPADFPKYIDTGNPDGDTQRYYAAKEKWYKENPERAAELNGKNNKTQQEITRARLNSLSDDRKQYILNNPDLFKIVD